MINGLLYEIRAIKGGSGLPSIILQAKVLAYVFERRKDKIFIRLQALLTPFKVSLFYTDDWGAYERNIDKDQHQIGKANT